MKLSIKETDYGWEVCDFLANYLTYEEAKYNPDVDDYFQDYNIPSHTILAVDEDNNTIYGVACIDEDDNNMFSLRYLAVNSNSRRKKIGTRMIHYILERFPCIGVTVTPELVNKDGIKFYQSVGFVKDVGCECDGCSHLCSYTLAC